MSQGPRDRTPSEAVLTAVADRDGIDPSDLTPRLSDVLDPEALDSLFKGGSATVTFDYRGYTVTVDQTGTVTLDDTSTH